MGRISVASGPVMKFRHKLETHDEIARESACEDALGASPTLTEPNSSVPFSCLKGGRRKRLFGRRASASLLRRHCRVPPALPA